MQARTSLHHILIGALIATTTSLFATACGDDATGGQPEPAQSGDDGAGIRDTDRPNLDDLVPDGDGSDPGSDVPGDDQPGDDQPGDDQPGDDQPGDDQPGDDQPGDDPPGDDQPGDDEPEPPTGGEIEPNDSSSSATPLDVEPGAEERIDGRLTPGDADYYRIEIAGPVELDAYITDGAGGCVLDTELSLLDAAGTELAYNDDSDTGLCSHLQAIGIASAGTYYLVVTGFFDDENGPYTLHVNLFEPICGDGRLSGGEECDDGGFETGDGCDGECLFEALEEEEPNDTFDQAHALSVSAATPALVRGQVDSGDDVDLFAVSMGVGDSFTRIDILGPGGECTFEPTLRVIAPDRITVLADAYDSWGTGCAELTGSTDLGITDVAEGTHYIEVGSADGVLTGTYLLNVVVREAECGNGVREGVETCDDGNEDPSDGCNTCDLDADPETEPNNDFAESDPLGTFEADGSTAAVGHIDPVGDRDYFDLTVADQARLEVWLDDGGDDCEFDTVIELFDAEGNSLARDDDGGFSGCSRLDKFDEGAVNLAAGEYFIMVQGFSDTRTGYYVMHATVTYPSCGDGFIEGDEVCDDGNDDSNDGCSSVCLPEGIAESEPNDNGTGLTAIDLTEEDGVLAVGQISSATDADYFAVTVGEGAELGARLWNGSGGCAVDSRMSLRSDPETVVREGTSLWGDEGCWQIGGTVDPYFTGEALEAGTYLIRVVGQSGDTGPYQLILWAD